MVPSPPRTCYRQKLEFMQDIKTEKENKKNKNKTTTKTNKQTTNWKKNKNKNWVHINN